MGITFSGAVPLMNRRSQKLLLGSFPIRFVFFCFRLTDNAELLKRRLKSLEDSREQLDDSLKQQIAYNRTLEREMHKLKPEIIILVKTRDKHIMYVSHLKLFRKMKVLLLFYSHFT